MKKKYRVLSLMLALAMIFTSLPVWSASFVYADETIDVQVTATYGQSDARSMLAMINDFRTGRYIDGNQSAVWAYNSSNQVDTSSYVNLGELEYDYVLEEIAMERAMELVVNYDHQRPDGTRVGTLVSPKYEGLYPYSIGENLAAGYGGGSASARQAFEGLCEAKYPFSGQGHRRNMLNRNHTCVGLAHVVVKVDAKLNGTNYTNYPYSTEIHYWVQVFSSKHANGGTVPTKANNQSATRTIKVSKSLIEEMKINADPSEISLIYGNSKEIAGLSTEMRMNGTWPDGFNLSMTLGGQPYDSLYGKYYSKIDDRYSFLSQSNAIASVSGNTVTGQGVGTTYIAVKSSVNPAINTNLRVTVNPADISTGTLTVNEPTVTFDGRNKTPGVKLTHNGKTLIKDTDYSLEYGPNVNVGTVNVTARGIGNYTNSKSASFSILPADISNSAYSAVVTGIESSLYTGKAQTPDPVVTLNIGGGSKTLIKGTDFDVSYKNNTSVGTATVSITGKGNYTGTLTKNFDILAVDLSADSTKTTVEGIKNATYNGSAITHPLTVKGNVGGKTITLSESNDYTVQYKNNVKVGTATITITGKNNFTGSISKTFTIDPADISKAAISGISDKTYTGSDIKQTPTVKLGNVTLKAGTDYTYATKNALEPGTATITVTGKGGYKGTVAKTFKINPVNLAAAETKTSVAGIKNVNYTGLEIKHNLTVKALVDGSEKTLREGRDYTVAYKNNIKAGTATITITGKGNFDGKVEKTFKINPLEISDAEMTAVSDMTYTGSAITQNLMVQATVNGKKVRLVNGTDYSVEYKDNVNAGTASVTIQGKGNFSGSLGQTFRINKVNLMERSVGTVIADIGDMPYQGTEITPVPNVTAKVGGRTVNLKNGTDYSIAYKNNLELGTATLTISGIGNYYGTKSTTFNIVRNPERIWVRLAGNGRYDTMERIVSEGFRKQGGTVVIATGTGFKDALAASGLAGLDDAPVVLTDGKNLSTQAKSILSNLKPGKVYIAGGPVAVSVNVENQIHALTRVRPERLAGDNSSKTSAKLALEGRGRWRDNTAIVATNKSFKDALSVAPISYAKRYPILLADNGQSLDKTVLDAMKSLGITQVIIVGGEVAVSKNVETQLRGAGIRIKSRLAGKTGVETSAAIARWGIANGLTANRMGVATSQNYPDALAGAALCGYNKAVLVLADDKAMANASFPRLYKNSINRGYVFGGEYAVGKKTWGALVNSTK